jgi:hypothetical protein
MKMLQRGPVEGPFAVISTQGKRIGDLFASLSLSLPPPREATHASLPSRLPTDTETSGPPLQPLQPQRHVTIQEPTAEPQLVSRARVTIPVSPATAAVVATSTPAGADGNVHTRQGRARPVLATGAEVSPRRPGPTRNPAIADLLQRGLQLRDEMAIAAHADSLVCLVWVTWLFFCGFFFWFFHHIFRAVSGRQA